MAFFNPPKIPKAILTQLKQNWVYLLGSTLLTGLFVCYWTGALDLNFDPKVIGVQISTDKGTIIVGRNKLTQSPIIWFSPLIGSFGQRGQPEFFSIESRQEKQNGKNWEIEWQWDELVTAGKKEILLSLAPTQKEKDNAIDSLSEQCLQTGSAMDSISCQWSVSDKLKLDGVMGKYLCLTNQKNEFYGGAHPMAITKIVTYNPQTRKAVKLEEILASDKSQDDLWQRLQTSALAVSEDYEELGGFSDEQAPKSQPSSGSAVDQLSASLNSLGYTLSPNSYCLKLRGEGTVFYFAFPHAVEVNRGTNLHLEAALPPASALSTDLNQVLKQFQFELGQDRKTNVIKSTKGDWKVLQGDKELIVRNVDLKLALDFPKESNVAESLLGITWLYRSPSLNSLKENAFRQIEMKGEEPKLDLDSLR